MNTTCEPSKANSCKEVKEETHTQKPKYDLHPTENEISLTVDLPGVGKENVQLQLEKQVLTIQAKRVQNTPEHWKTLHREQYSTDYLLRLRVPELVDEANLGAQFENGVLQVKMPRKAEATARHIQIQ